MNDRLKQMIQDLYNPLERRHQVLRDQLMTALPDQRAAKRSPRKRMIMRIMKFGGVSGVAAAILVAVVLWSMSHTVAEISAAEALKQATSATSGYVGWIHVESVGKPSDLESSFHVNPRDNTVAMVTNFNGNKEIEYLSAAKDEYLRYDVKTNTITRNVNNAKGTKAIADTAKRQFMPDGLIDDLGKHARLAVTRSKDGELARFDIANEGSRDIRFAVPQKLIVLVDPRTSLTQEIRTIYREDSSLTMKFTYGKPAIESIYDLGVPKDAKIVDAPPASQAATTSRAAAAGPQRAPMKHQIPAVAKLDMRLAPDAPGIRRVAEGGKDRDSGLSRTEREEYVDLLLRDGKLGEPQPGQKLLAYTWVPVEAEPSSLGALVWAERDGTVYVLLSNKPAEKMLASDAGDDAWGIKDAFVDRDQLDRPAVMIVLDERGAQRLGRLSRTHIGCTLAFVVNGKVFCVPVINSAIADMAIIEGDFSADDARSLAAAINAGMKNASPASRMTQDSPHKTPQSSYQTDK